MSVNTNSDIWSFTLSEDVESIGELLQDGVSVDARNSLGETPLHLAAGRGLECVAKALLDAGADVHLADWESGWTPLHRSLYFGHIRLSLLLLQAGALLDGGQDNYVYRAGSSKNPRLRSRSESLGAFCPNPGSARSTTARQRSDSLGDDDGNSPLDLLSLELRPQLKAACDRALGGDVYSFGKADFFLGYDTFGKADVISPRRVEALANLRVLRLAASRYHSAAVTLCGKLFTWGHGRSGRLGHGHEEVCMLPTLVVGLANQTVVDVAASETHTAALTVDGELYTWGRDRFGQLGHGSGSSGRLAPKRVEGLRKMRVVGVATGTEHTAVVTSSGVCYTWGRNNHGQLGLAGASQTSAPRAVSYLTSGASRGAGGVGRHVIKVSASARSTLVVTAGVSRGSGLHPVNEVHQWGHGSHVPSRVIFNASNSGGSSSRWQTHDARVNITDVAAAKYHNLALSSVGQVFTWGFGADNLGLDPRETRTARGPKLVTAMLPDNCGGNAVHVSASDQHSCVVTDTGDLFTWGTAGEDGGALGLGDKRWQPVAKRVPSLKKVASVAAAPDHTVVLLQAHCPPLPHDASLTNPRGQPEVELCRARTLGPEEASEHGGDVDSDFGDGPEDEKESPRDDRLETLVGAYGPGANEISAPLTLKQHCEIVLAREVDLRNAASLLAYADALDAPALVEYCAQFVSANLDGILVLGRESDRCCLLETCGALARSLLCGRGARAPRVVPSVAEPGNPDAEAMSGVHEGEEGLDRVAMATALARADMRAATPSTKAAARAVRSLKKKIARLVELEGRRDSGKDLSADQLWRVEQKSRMEAELSSLDSQLERAKLAEAVRDRRLQTEGKMSPVASANSSTPDVKRSLFPDDGCVDAYARTTLALDSDDNSGKKGQQWTPQLDLTQDEHKANEKRPIKCEACRVECASAKMYADHLQGKRHRATTTKLERQLHDAAKASQLQHGDSLTWAHVSLQGPHTVASTAAHASPPAKPAAGSTLATSSEGTGRGRVSCPDAAIGPSRDLHVSHLVSRGVKRGTMRESLEQQHKAATMWMGDTGKEPAVIATGHGMTPLRSSTPSSSIRDSSQPVAYSLVDFIAPDSKKLSRRKGSLNDGKQAQVARVWGADGKSPPGDASSTTGGQGHESRTETAGEVDGRLQKKSFHEIIEEEEREKKERDEYGNSVWFVSRKPRSTSFEGIVKQQRREEQAAEEEKAREMEDEMEEDMLRFVLEMSKHETKRDSCSESKAGHTKQRPSLRGGQAAGRGSRHRKGATRPQRNSKEEAESNAGTRVAKTPRKQTTPGAKSASGPRHSNKDGEPVRVPSSSGRSRKSKVVNRSGTVAGQAVNQERKEAIK